MRDFTPPKNPTELGFDLVFPVYPPGPPAEFVFPKDCVEVNSPAWGLDEIGAVAFGWLDNKVGPLEELGVPAGAEAFVADVGFKSRPAGLADPDNSGAVTFEGALATEVSLKLMLNAPLPQNISPPVKINAKLLEGVELQLPPGI